MDSNFDSIILYIICGFICVLLAKRCEKNIKAYFWCIVLLLTLVSGLRSPSVGIDTAGYVEIMRGLQSGFKFQISNVTEIGFLGISYFSIKYTGGYTCAFIVFGFLTNYLIIKRLYDARSEISFPLAIYMYYCQYYFMSLNIVRQWVSIAIIFYFSQYIGKKKIGNIIFILSVLVAMMFHKTAIIGLILIAVYYFTTNSKKWYVQVAKLSLVIIMPLFTIWIYQFFFSTYGNVYGAVINGTISSVNILRLLIIISIAYISHNENARNMCDSEEKIMGIQLQKFNLLAYCIGTVITLGVLFYKYIDRVGLYLVVFELLVLPRYAKGKYRQVVILICVLLFAYLRIMSFASNGYGELPYVPFWK